jgi:hypothetical protein
MVCADIRREDHCCPQVRPTGRQMPGRVLDMRPRLRQDMPAEMVQRCLRHARHQRQLQRLRRCLHGRHDLSGQGVHVDSARVLWRRRALQWRVRDARHRRQLQRMRRCLCRWPDLPGRDLPVDHAPCLQRQEQPESVLRAGCRPLRRDRNLQVRHRHRRQPHLLRKRLLPRTERTRLHVERPMRSHLRAGIGLLLGRVVLRQERLHHPLPDTVGLERFPTPMSPVIPSEAEGSRSIVLEPGIPRHARDEGHSAAAAGHWAAVDRRLMRRADVGAPEAAPAEWLKSADGEQEGGRVSALLLASLGRSMASRQR